MGEALHLFRFDFNGSFRVEAKSERLTSDSGALILRELMEKLGIIEWITEKIEDPRNPDLITHPLAELLRTNILLYAQGWRDHDDADVLRHDGAFRLAVSSRRGISPLKRRSPREDGRLLDKNPQVPDGLASQPTLSRLVQLLSVEQHREVLRSSLLEVAARRIRGMRKGCRPRYLTLDIDSLPIEVHGHQPGSKYNGHYHTRIYHPLIASIAETGDLIDARLREGNVHTAEGGVDFITSLISEVEKKLCQVASVRIDAGFPSEKLLKALEDRKTGYVARVKNNAVLNRLAKPYLKRPPGRPPAEPRTWFHEMSYQAKSWSCDRRVVLVVVEVPGEMFCRHFWLITNWPVQQMSGEQLLDLYRERGTAEGHMGELMDVLEPALSSSPRPKRHYRGLLPNQRTPSCDSFSHNEVILLLNILAYNVAHTGRVLMERSTRTGWSLRRFVERVLKVAGRIVLHSRHPVLIPAASALNHWQSLLAQMSRFRPEPV